MLSKNCEKWLLASCLLVCKKQTDFHWRDFHEIWYFSIFWESVKNIKALFKSDKNTGTLHEHLRTFIIVFQWLLLKVRNVSDIKTHKLCSTTFSKNHAIYEIMLKNMAEPNRAQMIMQYSACALHTGYLRLYTHILRICNSYCFSTATMVIQMHLIVALYIHCPVLSNTVGTKNSSHKAERQRQYSPIFSNFRENCLEILYLPCHQWFVAYHFNNQ